MRNSEPLILIAILATLRPAAMAQEKPLDLTAPANYAAQFIPPYITRDNTPPDNEITDLGATLGRVLFYDRRLSRNDTVSCASCHHQDQAFGDFPTASTGVNGTTGRHSMRLINARFSAESRFFWDERAATAEQQASQPILDHVEMGFSGTNGDPDFTDLIAKLSATEEYPVLFTGVFGDSEITENRVQRSLAQFVRSIQSFDSKYDAGRALAPDDGTPFTNFTAQENAGKQLFLAPPPQGGAGCAACHRAPEFDIDPNTGNNGVVASLGGGSDFSNTRSPSLRDLVDSAGSPHGGFMHDASLPDLLAVVNHYNAIPAIVTGLDRRLTRPGGPPPAPPQPQSLNLTVAAKDSLVAFLRTLTGTSVYTDEKWSDPFNADGTLPYIVLPTPAMNLAISDNGGDRSVTLTTHGVPHVNYFVQSSTDLHNWTSHPVSATVDGVISTVIVGSSSDSHCYYRLVYSPRENTEP